MPKRMKSLGSLRFRHTGPPQRGLPEEVVEFSAAASRVHTRSRGMTSSPSGCCHGNVTASGGDFSACARIARAMLSAAGSPAFCHAWAARTPNGCARS